MKVLITGGAGFIGSHTVDLLLKKGYEVRIVDNLSPPVHHNHQKPEYIPDDVEFIFGDILNKADMERVLRGVNIVYHLAAYQDYLTDFSKFAFVNDGGTALLYEIIVNEHLPVEKVIIGSSQAAYGEGKYECMTHGIQYPPPRELVQLVQREWDIRCPVCGEDMKLLASDESRVNPHNQYAISKYAQELYALRLGKRFNIPTVVLRYSITQGARQSFFNAYSGILRIFTVRLLNGLPAIIYEDGNQLRDCVYVGDVVAANLLVLESNKANYQSYNVGGSKTISVRQYADILLDIMGKENMLQMPGEFRLGDTRHAISDSSKLTELGWESNVRVKQIAEEYVEWASNQPEVSDYTAEAGEVMKRKGVILAARGEDD